MSDIEQIRIFSVDDHPLLHEGLATVIRHQPDMLLVAEAFKGRDALQLFREHIPDVTLMDLRLPDISGLDATASIRTEFPDARVIILTTFAGEAEIRRAVDAGASGYMLKSMPPKELMEAIRQVHAGKRLFPASSTLKQPVKLPESEAADANRDRASGGFRRFTDWLRRK